MNHRIYLQLFPVQKAEMGQTLLLSDVARLEGKDTLVTELAEIPIYTIGPGDKSHVVIDILTVLQSIHHWFPDIEIDVVGPTQTVTEIETPRSSKTSVLLVFVWILLFVGAGLTIMNFHEDVSMLEVHQKLHFLITGSENKQPLFIQIPYSFGLGIGMILFFNHIFKKRLNEEPSPLELEMHQYNQEINRYLAETESDRSSKTWNSNTSSPSS